MSFWVYILKCADGTYYTGHTDDLERRIAQHDAGHFPGYTHDRRPLVLMFADWFQTRFEAIERERKIKDWSRKKKEALFRSDWQALVHAAKGRSGRPAASVFSTSSKQTGLGEKQLAAEGYTAPFGQGERSSPIRLELVENQLAPAPLIVLVRPQLAENIGKAARAMLNFGLTELRLVTPRDGWPNPDAGPAAAGADQVIADAQVFDSVAEAVADCAHVYATTVRKRGVTKPVVTPAEAASAIWTAPGRSAILFGPERAGLETEDVALARTIVTVPINREFGSLNLAQAVILCAYEWSKGHALAQPPLVAAEPPAPQAELEGLVTQLDAMLDHAGFYFPPDKVPTMRRNIRSLLTKPGWSAPEVRTLRGVLTALHTPRPSNRSSS